MLESKLMKLFSLLKENKKFKRRTLEDYKQELLLKVGREQFRQLANKGLSVSAIAL